MSYGTTFHGSIHVTPAIAERLQETSFADEDTAWQEGTDLKVVHETVGDGPYSTISILSEEERGDRDGVVADLETILQFTGDGYTFDGEFIGTNHDTEETFRIRVVDGQVVDEDGETIFGTGIVLDRAFIEAHAGRKLTDAQIEQIETALDLGPRIAAIAAAL